MKTCGRGTLEGGRDEDTPPAQSLEKKTHVARNYFVAPFFIF
jgi:hypothetical protein